jgi:hypothetical protein
MLNRRNQHMPKQQLALEPGGAKRLEISYGLNWKNVSIKLDGREIGVIPDQNTLKEGRTFKLDDGSDLSVQLTRSALSTELRVLRNGKPLPGSASDPARKLATSYGVIFFVGGLSAVIGLLAEIGNVDFLRGFGAGWFTVIIGVLFIGLGFLVRQRMLLALYAAIALYALDAILLVVTAVSVPGGRAPISGIALHVVFLIFMYQGVGAIQELDRQAQMRGA